MLFRTVRESSNSVVWPANYADLITMLSRTIREFQTHRSDSALSGGRAGGRPLMLSLAVGAVLTITSSAAAQTYLDEAALGSRDSDPPVVSVTGHDEDSQPSDNVWAELSLEELLNVQLSRREPMGIHHTHTKGEWMLHASSMFMRMDDNRSGTNRMSDAEALADFPVAPTRMETEMYMFGLMYAPVDQLTFMVMAPYIRKSMDHVTRTGMTFRTRSEGLGDIKLTGLHTIWETSNHTLHVDLGLSIPTGSINKRDMTPAGRVRLPYPMQLGSGTWDILPGVTYQGHKDDWLWGANVNGTIRFGRNTNRYRLGDRLHASTWVSYTFADSASAHLRVNGYFWQNIRGADPQLNSAMVPTADPKLRGGERIDLGIGVNLFASDDGPLSGHRLSCEFAVPIYQSLDGPQLETEWTIKIGWNWQF